MSLFNDLFVNLSILVTLLFVFNLLTRNRKGFISTSAKLKRRVHMGINMGLMGIVLMYYTIQFNGTIVDLRQIPVVLAASYGGFLPAVIAALIIAVVRITLFGISHASIMAGCLMLLIGISCGILSKAKMGLYKKMLVMTVSDSLLTSIVFFMLIHDRATLMKIYFAYWFVSLAGGFFVILLMEYLRKSKEQFQMAEENASTDFLTGLYNVRKFDELLKDSLDKADRHQEQVSVILIDIDHFKRINDTYGHQAGDEVLNQLGVVLKAASRSIDIVSRNGGEEFSVILPSCGSQDAIEVAERIRGAVAARIFTLWNGVTIRTSISLGVSTYGETTYRHDEIIKQADDSLYRAKTSGRDKVVLAN